MRHQQKMAIAHAAKQHRDQASTLSTYTSDYDQYQLLVHNMHLDLKQSGKLKNGAERNEYVSSQVLPVYLSHCKAYIENCKEFSEKVFENPVLVQTVIWLFNCKQISDAIEFGLVACEQQQPMPENWKRDMSTFVADEVLAWSDGEFKLNHSPQPYFSRIFELVSTGELVVCEPLKMKYYKLAAQLANRDEDYEKAYEYVCQAQQLDPIKSQVVTMKYQLEKKLKLT